MAKVALDHNTHQVKSMPAGNGKITKCTGIMVSQMLLDNSNDFSILVLQEASKLLVCEATFIIVECNNKGK